MPKKIILGLMGLLFPGCLLTAEKTGNDKAVRIINDYLHLTLNMQFDALFL